MHIVRILTAIFFKNLQFPHNFFLFSLSLWFSVSPTSTEISKARKERVKTPRPSPIWLKCCIEVVYFEIQKVNFCPFFNFIIFPQNFVWHIMLPYNICSLMYSLARKKWNKVTNERKSEFSGIHKTREKCENRKTDNSWPFAFQNTISVPNLSQIGDCRIGFVRFLLALP